MKTLAAVALLFAPLALAAQQTNCPSGPVKMFQPNGSLTSPAGMAFTHFTKTSTTTVFYSSPGVHCRKIFGELVPFGQVWRTGANVSTTLVSEVPLKIGTLTVPAGTHSIYTVPGAPGQPWQLIVNNQTGQWGTIYDAKNDLGRTPLTAGAAPATAVEQMTITFEKSATGGQELHIRWDKTDQFVAVSLAQ